MMNPDDKCARPAGHYGKPGLPRRPSPSEVCCAPGPPSRPLEKGRPAQRASPDEVPCGSSPRGVPAPTPPQPPRSPSPHAISDPTPPQPPRCSTSHGDPEPCCSTRFQPPRRFTRFQPPRRSIPHAAPAPTPFGSGPHAAPALTPFHAVPAPMPFHAVAKIRSLGYAFGNLPARILRKQKRRPIQNLQSPHPNSITLQMPSWVGP